MSIESTHRLYDWKIFITFAKTYFEYDLWSDNRKRKTMGGQIWWLLGQWNDVVWLRNFFKANLEDLTSYFKITDVNQAIYDTIDDSERLQCLIMDISPEADLDKLFRPLDNSRTSEMILGKEKARLHNTPKHASWLRIYAIKLEPGIYVITGGAIKLTRTMQEREHTLVELARMEKVRRFMLDNNIMDKDSFDDYRKEL